MLKKIFIFAMSILFLNACASKQDTFSQVNQIAKKTQCVPCESLEGFEAKIKGLLYISDIGIRCCANKRTLDTGVALKKVYLHRFYDLKENQKVLNVKGKKLLVDVNFNAVFYVYLKQELEARGIIVLDNNEQDSPYVSKIDLNLVSYNALEDAIGLHSRLVGVLHVSDINKNKKFTIRTKQEVQGFNDLKEITFYTHLLIKQMANKAASLISDL
ncbi:hypothetical protein N4T57_03970 [Campylobacter hepaticus]|uniref:Membrane liproprotein MapA n=1 Tax=Campylobacter hepaticus TaxID=1813019 RepID=A0A424Z1X9_9BACT|nr:outer membrane lipoprotein MapA [Campylobacter hepaticus]AXP08474.1 hypothetical protein A2J15_001815 [Campylobacter hepaticus]MCZ0772310.1 hypothetical protein [Campylobacter hepaticus]MCZ0773778.1 hypothetical protein [Campylobacter hepaticus]MCZ0775029.1 hypothetical protein [Campylobacter hepaticus]MDX2322898.1 outer membrane lipoprotein MapA [Campylobacter hepaticus]